MGFFLKTPQDKSLEIANHHLDRIATALEIIVRESYGIALSAPPPDLSLEISYTEEDTDPEAQEILHTWPYPVTPAIGDEDEEP